MLFFWVSRKSKVISHEARFSWNLLSKSYDSKQLRVAVDMLHTAIGFAIMRMVEIAQLFLQIDLQFLLHHSKFQIGMLLYAQFALRVASQFIMALRSKELRGRSRVAELASFLSWEDSTFMKTFTRMTLCMMSARYPKQVGYTPKKCFNLSWNLEVVLHGKTIFGAVFRYKTWDHIAWCMVMIFSATLLWHVACL